MNFVKRNVPKNVTALGEGFRSFIAIPARRRATPPGLAHFIASVAIIVAWCAFFIHVWNLRSVGNQEAASTVVIVAAAIYSYRRVHWFMLRGHWYSKIWYDRRVLGVRVFDWFAVHEDRQSPNEMDERRAILKIAHSLDLLAGRAQYRIHPTRHTHHWEFTTFEGTMHFTCQCGLSMEAHESDFDERFSNDDVTRLFESQSRTQSYKNRPDSEL